MKAKTTKTHASTLTNKKGKVCSEEEGTVTVPNPPRPARPKNAKLTPARAKLLRLYYGSGRWNLNQLAKHFGLSWPTTRSIVNGTSWRDVGGPIDPTAGRRGEKDKGGR
jgi:hypothetical protein